MKRFLAFVMALVVAVAPVTSVQAATKTVNTKTSREVSITKTGKYKVVHTADFADKRYITFKAPKAGRYTFKFSELTYKGETSDMRTEDYLDGFGGSKYNREWIMSADVPSRSSWTPVYYNGSPYISDIVNYHSAISKMYVHGDYNSMAEVVQDVIDGNLSDNEIINLIDPSGETGMWTSLTLNLRKGSKISFVISGDGNPSYATLTIKRK